MENKKAPEGALRECELLEEAICALRRKNQENIALCRRFEIENASVISRYSPKYQAYVQGQTDACVEIIAFLQRFLEDQKSSSGS